MKVFNLGVIKYDHQATLYKEMFNTILRISTEGQINKRRFVLSSYLKIYNREIIL